MAEKEKQEPFQKFGITLENADMTDEICREILRIKGEANLKGIQITNKMAAIELLTRGVRK